MKLSTSTTSKQFKTVPAGSHLGRLYKIVDIGTQQGEWKGKATYSRKAVFYFELHGDDAAGQPLAMDDGKPMIVTKYYNVSLNEKSTLRKHLEAWLNIDFNSMPEGFEASSLLGKFAMVNVTNYLKDGNTKSSVESLTAVPSIVSKHGLPAGINDIFMFDLDKFDSAKYESLSDGIKNLIQNSPEFRSLAQKGKAPSKAAIDDDFNDDVPF